MLDGQDKDAIIDVTSYHRRDYDLATIRFNPADHEPVRESLVHAFPTRAHVSLGDLDRFPVELLDEICLTLDVRSLFHFRHLNRRSRQIVGALGQYQPAIEHGLNAFRALLKTDCLLCSSFDGFVFLPCYSRCCFNCLLSSPQLRARTHTSAAKKVGITSRLLRKSTPSLHTLPAMYSLDQVSRKRRIDIIAEHHLQLGATDRHGHGRATAGANANTDTSTQELAEMPILTFMAASALPYFNECTKSVQRGVCCKGCQVAIEEGLVTSTGDGTSHQARDRVYSHEGFLQHFQWCAQAQDMWEASLHGQGPFIEPEWTCRGGCFGLRDVVLSY
ncbi:F-box domain-containing protein [Tothia fuscella]|uniref:F-box domain-containing protein n=1 Tax=Tothia fuscella TaxID=1048955 RepID=A0A9P4NL04_9PEZI|nr:F-box domain-containing protein [Tothia fuscella]